MSTEPSEGHAPNKSAFRRVLKSDSFIENAFLLILTAALSGAVVPLIIKSVDVASDRRTELTRAQAKLFDDISETIMTCEALALDVSWFGTAQAKNVEMQKKAFDRYTERTVDLIARWRTESARAQSLASPEVAKRIDAFQYRFFAEQDTPMNGLWIKCNTSCDWKEQHAHNEAMLAQANLLILDLAHELGMARDSQSSSPGTSKER
ncbi:hypothetical protein [Paraburkholderia sp. BL10I2N1]|uniref:hypothetical protein n=1 Tax=Paraburkholderia sp. BL10I2N1 TaxID=1938796 RepID=UPI001061AC6C|nr:hypothetical protein [Paraburkholderia sp. BL10I2N1]TDN63966.1 hypothetical protein B0G77_7660 [Paraburkholderia sp. BL10I2N1]